MHKKGHITVYQCVTLSLNLRLQAPLHTTDIKIKYSVLVMVVMDACPASHHVTVWYCIVQVSIVLVDQTRVVAIEETIPWTFTAVESEASILFVVVMVTADPV